MSKIWIAGVAAIGLVTVCSAFARAENISTKTLLVKDNANQAKRQVLVQSVDSGVAFSEAGDPSANGASLHVYSATDDFCALLPSGSGWKQKKSSWKFKSTTTKDSALIKDGKLVVRIKSGVTFTLADNGTQGTVNVQVQFGTGTRYCLRCAGNKKDTAAKFLGKNCAAASCDPEPSVCEPPTTGSTTTTQTGGTNTTTTLPSGGTILKGALTATPGRFNYNLAVGLPAANSACNTHFPGTHACTLAELQSAQTAGDLAGLKDTSNATVTSFWAIDGTAPALEQCQDDVTSLLNWEYATAHTASRGRHVDLNNAAGTLGALSATEQCNFSNRWVGCCQ